MPLQGVAPLGHAREDRVGPALGGELHLQHPDLGRALPPAGAAEGVGQQLMAQAHPEEGALKLAHPAADGLFLRHQPRVLVGVPHIHGAAHHPQGVVVLQVGDGLALIELHRIPLHPVVPQEVPELARVLALDMLKDQKPHGRLVTTRRARRPAKSRSVSEKPGAAWTRTAPGGPAVSAEERRVSVKPPAYLII